MKLSRKIAPLFIVLISTTFSIAQTGKERGSFNEYRATHWSLQEGLSQAENYHMIKDRYGFMWIGSKVGLNRFDGSSFKLYYNNPEKPGGIPGNNIMGLVEDSLHNIWIGTENGIARYNISADTFTSFFPEKRHTTFKDMLPFWATKDEVFCIEKEFEIVSFNTRSLAKRSLARLDDFEGLFFGPAPRYTVFDGRTKSLWLLLREPFKKTCGLLKLTVPGGEKQFFTWPVDKNKGHYGRVHDAEAMKYDPKRHSIWINSTDGLLEFTLSDEKFRHISISGALIPGSKYDEDLGRFVGIDLDTHGRVWLATVRKGIVIYNPEDQSACLPFAADSVMQTEISDANASIYCDRDGIVWTGSWLRRGVYQLNPYSPVVKRYRADKTNPNSLSDDLVFTCGDAGEGKIWIGTSDGLNIFDPRDDKFLTLRAKDLPGLKSNFIFPLSIDTVIQKAWLHATGIYEMDMKSGKCRPVIFHDSNNQIVPTYEGGFITKFQSGLIFTISFNEQTGIFVLKPDSAVARQVLSFPIHSVTDGSVSTNGYNKIFLKRKDSAGRQTYTYTGSQWELTPGKLDSISWNCLIYNELDQTYWVAAFQQLMHYDKEFRLLEKYTTENGIPEFEIYSIVVDNRGIVWFNTDRSIYQLNPNTAKIGKITEKDGFRPQDFTPEGISAYRSASGDLYFPGGLFGKGFDRVRPDMFQSTSSDAYVRSLKINGNIIPLQTGVNELREISLRHFQNNITVETGIIDYYSNGQSIIRYKLEGINDNWQLAPYYAAIRYENLPPGNHNLLMQASNAANEFNGPVKRLLIKITPAFWNTWWFRILAIVSAGGLLYALIRWRLQQKFRMKLERSEREREMSDMKQKGSELEMQALRSQMNPHFIFNSLNSINRFILQNNKVQASEYLTKFSKLVRLILQNSQAPMISLESELESLALYLDLEALRFDHRFAYKISVPKDLDIDALKVPPLIIQPYAENAIWHGLMHKDEKGQLDIEVSQESDYLYFRIADDGIGRKNSAALASKSATRHKSLGLKITSDRIAILQNSNGSESPVKINDLVNPDGSAAGTEVIIKMPVIYD